MCCVFVLLLLGFEFDMMKYLKSLLSFGNQPLLKPWAGVLFEYSEALFESIRLSCGWKLIKAVFWRYPHCFTGGEKIKKKAHLTTEMRRRISFSHLLNEFFTTCLLNVDYSLASWCRFGSFARAINHYQVPRYRSAFKLSIITSISSSQSERRPTSVSRPPLSLAGSEMWWRHCRRLNVAVLGMNR